MTNLKNLTVICVDGSATADLFRITEIIYDNTDNPIALMIEPRQAPSVPDRPLVNKPMAPFVRRARAGRPRGNAKHAYGTLIPAIEQGLKNGPLKAAELATVINYPQGSVNSALHRRKDLFVSQGDGKWTLK